ncbi:MAG: cobalt-precorrin-7 (C(5))-methyltransferase [Cellulosilyticaceae bacterium]
MISVVGMGPGDGRYLTAYGHQKIQEADKILGSKRHLQTLGKIEAKTYVLEGALMGWMVWLKQYKSQNIVVLASGDPLIYGIGHLITEELGLEHVEIISGISAIQYLFAQVGMAMNEVYITSSHGKVPDFEYLLRHPKVAMVTDQHIGPREIAGAIIKQKLSKKMIIGENLSYSNEKIKCYSLEEVMAEQKFDMNVVVIIDEE